MGSPRGHPEALGAGMGVEDATHDRLGHPRVRAVHDREKGCLDAPGRRHRVDLVRVESGPPLRERDGQRDERRPPRKVVQEPGVVDDALAVAVERRLHNHRPHVRLHGGRAQGGHRTH